MNLPIFLVTLVGLSTLALSSTVSSESDEKPTDSSVETFDSYAVRNLPQQMPLQLPREEPAVPFYPIQPVPYLRAPQFVPDSQPNFYPHHVPIPSEYLTAPTEGAWNPKNDPAYYYELPASITKENVPTNLYPKKYNKDIHSKAKPLNAVPKKEISLEPISESEYQQKQKELYKTVQRLNKNENHKYAGNEKVPIRVRPYLRQKNIKTLFKDNAHRPTKLTIKQAKKLLTSTTPKPAVETKNDSSESETTYQSDSESVPSSNTNKFTKGLSSTIIDSLGIPSTNTGSGAQKDRVLFHMAGHDGPMSYKWGYDTGIGHNRQFRFEERDKEGIVKGQFGYYDKEGKFRMMNYNAHPEHGFHMEPAPESESKE